MEEKYLIALEIGSSKIKGAIGVVDQLGTLSVKAVEEEKLTDGVRYGCIRNVVETAAAIKNVIDKLEMREPGRKVTGVYVSIGGRSLMSQQLELERRLPTEMEITNELISDITNEALNYQLHERSIVAVEPCEFRVDNASAARAVGMFGSHVDARLNLISCRTQLMRNLNHVLDERLHLAVNDIFVRQIAEADLVLFNEEKRQGCMLVDFGAETTTVSIYKNGVLLYLATIPMGSRNITRDITALNYLEERAEELKIAGGNALSTPDNFTGVSTQPSGIDFTLINNYVAARAGEIIANINEQIKYAGLTPDKLPAGIILTGRGARLNGFDRRLAGMTDMKVRVGLPANRIRILDSRINGADHVDVISVLAQAARARDIKECMTQTRTYVTPEETAYVQAHAQQPSPEPHHPTSPQQPQYPRQPQPQPSQPQQGGYSNPYAEQAEHITNATDTRQGDTNNQEGNYYPDSHKGGLAKAWKSLRDRVAQIMTEPVEDDDVDN